MKTSEFRTWFEQLPRLSRGEAERVRRELGGNSAGTRRELGGNSAGTRRELGGTAPVPETVQWLERLCQPRCLQCDGDRCDRWGHQAGLQRFRCRACGRAFTATSGTPLARLRLKSRWLTFSEALKNGLTVRASAALCDVDKNTSFRWRHRFLTLPASSKASQLQGIVEADETYFPHSCKGQRRLERPPRKRGKQIRRRGTGKDQVPVLVVRDRSGATADFKLNGTGTDAMEPPLRAILAKDAILCSDGGAVYRAVASQLGVTHRPVNLTAGVRVIAGVYHIQNVNAYDSRLKLWMERFHGVATKYLENYLGWRRWLERWGSTTQPSSLCKPPSAEKINFNC